MKYTDKEILARVDAIDKSTWFNKTGGLFVDIGTKWNPDAPYSVNRPTNDESIYLGDIYRAIGDPTDYKFAIRTFGTFPKWEQIKKASWGQHLSATFKKELATKLKSKAVADIISLADDEETKETTKLQALKFIVAEGWAEAPEKKDAKAVEKEKKQIKHQIAGDLERIGLKVVK